MNPKPHTGCDTHWCNTHGVCVTPPNEKNAINTRLTNTLKMVHKCVYMFQSKMYDPLVMALRTST